VPLTACVDHCCPPLDHCPAHRSAAVAMAANDETPAVSTAGVDAAGGAGGAALGGGGVDRKTTKTGLRHHGGLAGGGRAQHGAPGACHVPRSVRVTCM